MLNYQRVTIRSERHNELIGPFVSQSIGSHLVHSRMQSERCIHKTIFDTILYPIVQSQLLHNIYIHMTTVYCTRTSVSSEVPHRHFNRKTRPVFSWSEIHKPAASPYDSTGYALWTFWRHQPHQPLRAFWQPLSFSEKTKWLVTGLAICRWEPRIGDWKGLPWPGPPLDGVEGVKIHMCDHQKNHRDSPKINEHI